MAAFFEIPHTHTDRDPRNTSTPLGGLSVDYFVYQRPCEFINKALHSVARIGSEFEVTDDLAMI